uniref:interferon alpha/beta receptor 1-like isoform X2 n=1 Tax=Myxine glutinosa TaxID=7769 RepID=UPI00358EF505
MMLVHLSVAWLLVNGIACSSASPIHQLSPTFFSINLKTIVKWTPVEDSAVYTAEIKGNDWHSWKGNAACVDSRVHECDVTSLCTDVHTKYIARVRVQRKNVIYSIWEYTTEFIPYKDTILGAPAAKLDEVNRTLWAHVQAPQIQLELPNNQPASLAELLPDITYELKYWRDGSSGKKTFTSSKEFFVLPGVDPTSQYCATARIVLGEEKRKGLESDAVCFTPSGRHRASPIHQLSPTFFSINLKTIVKWTPVEDSAVYTAEIKGHDWHSWKGNAACVDSRVHECDVTSLCTDVHTKYTARVRVQRKNVIYSVWEYTTEFIPYKDTILGAPAAKLDEVNRTLWAHVQAPQIQLELPNNQPASLAELLPDITYELKYWRDGSSGKKTFTSSKEFFVLPGVDPTSQYCATARIVLGEEKRKGLESDAVCFTPSGRHRDKFSAWIYILVGFVVVAAVVILIVALYCCCKSSDKKTEQPENLKLKDFVLDN